MDNCNKHPDHVQGYSGTLQELAQAIGNMRYDQTEKVIYYVKELD